MNKLIFSYTITAACSWVGMFLFPLMVLGITDSSLLVSISYAISMTPYLVFTPFIGVLGGFL